jgi:hypothetical protein
MCKNCDPICYSDTVQQARNYIKAIKTHIKLFKAPHSIEYQRSINGV